MKILHCCLSCFYNDNYNYQENLLPQRNKLDGHDVMIVASTEVFDGNKEIGYTQPGKYTNCDGIEVIRVPYKKINVKIANKIRAYQGVYSILKDFSPDVILFHGLGAWELLNVAKYAKKNGIKLYSDNHANYFNSGTNWLSLKILHKIFYKKIILKALPVVEKVLCIGIREMKFAQEVYGIPEDKIEYYPLGGYVLPEKEYEEKRKSIRTELNLSEEHIFFLHSGKMGKEKKTVELIRAFKSVKNPQFCLCIAGSLLDDVEDIVLQEISKDKRIRYLGWKSGNELQTLLCGADVYLQPGTPSSTLQNAMCYKCAIMAQPIEEYKFLLADEGMYVNDEDDMRHAFESISKNMVSDMADKTLKRAKKLLDYEKLAARLYE